MRTNKARHKLAKVDLSWALKALPFRTTPPKDCHHTQRTAKDAKATTKSYQTESLTYAVYAPEAVRQLSGG
eukprot:scaffold88342_cov27-Prasinocladus_malaysianus.AAC.1